MRSFDKEVAAKLRWLIEGYQRSELTRELMPKQRAKRLDKEQAEIDSLLILIAAGSDVEELSHLEAMLSGDATHFSHIHEALCAYYRARASIDEPTDDEVNAALREAAELLS